MHVRFASLPVADQDRAIDFYTSNFPCSVVVDTAYGDDGWRWVDPKFDNAETMLHFDKREDDKHHETPDLVFVDPDLERTIDSLRSNGVAIITGPGDAPWNPDERFAEFRDSEGNRMVLASA